MPRLARSLESFRSEINARCPNRSKVSDGWIGDAAHQGSASDHNPNPQGVVCAFDLTHDPANGVDCFAISEFLRTHRPPALKYLIFNRRICSAKSGWEWRPNRGHEKHMHSSVGVGPDGRSTGPYDDTTLWLNSYDVAPPTQGDTDMTPGQCRDLVGRKWFFYVGDDKRLQASVDGAKAFPIGGIWTSGCDAMTEDDGRIVITGRAADGQLQQCIIYTDGNTVKPPGTAPEFELLGGHLYPPA